MSAARSTGTGPGVTCRRALESDVPAIIDLYTSMSEQSVRMRFFGGMPRASLEAAAGLGDDGEVVAVLALDGRRVVGEARYVMHGDGEYELGIVVAEGSQHRGVGHRLLDVLRQEAAANGIARLHAVVRVDNLAMLRTLRSVGSVLVTPAEDMVVVVEVSCDDAMPGWRPATAGRRVLVEFNSLWAAPATDALRAAGFDVRQCLGPRRGCPQTCPLILSGSCRLADQADVVACLLPEDEPSCRQVAENHAARRPARLAARSLTEWQSAAPRLIRS